MNYTIKENVIKEYVINKSKFIVCLIKLNKLDINNELNELKKNYKGANHYCYAYIFKNYEKCSDDGEPSGTAGIPILNVLKKNNLNNVLCVVVRYFGGIKLGAGGLVRAYSNTVSETIRESIIIENIEYKTLKLEFSYDSLKDIEYILRDFEIQKSFNEKINFKINIDSNKINEIINKINNINNDIKITKED
ncbi:MAG: YigZ family protein [Bacilli bacterium]|nr:YigZ family protein [Bacilli bacterium]